MKITKFHQSCLLLEIKDKKILIDPGKIGYTEKMYEKYWKNINYIFITHKHNDHCFDEVIKNIVKRDNAKLYISSEVANNYDFEKYVIVKAGDTLQFEGFNVEVTKAVHGYLPGMNDNEVKENIGYIFDDFKKRLYVTSDSLCFNNNYKCDIICMPFNGNGLTFGGFEGPLFAKEVCAKLIIPVHLEHPNPVMMPDLKKVKTGIENLGMEYKFLDILETFEI